MPRCGSFGQRRPARLLTGFHCQAMPASIPAVKKRVVLLGSGLVAGPCVDVLTSYDDIELVIGSDNLQQAEALARRSKRSRVAAVQIDADDFGEDPSRVNRAVCLIRPPSA